MSPFPGSTHRHRPVQPGSRADGRSAGHPRPRPGASSSRPAGGSAGPQGAASPGAADAEAGAAASDQGAPPDAARAAGPGRARSGAAVSADRSGATRPADRRGLASSPDVLVRRAVTLLLLTLLLPGSAHWVAGDRRVARIALGVVVGCLSVTLLLAVAAVVDLGAVLGLLADSTLLRRAGGLRRRGRAGGSRAPRRRVAARPARRAAAPGPAVIAAGTALAVLLVTTVAVAGARRAWAGASLLDDVFHGGAAAGAVDGRYTVLLLGGDAGPDRVGTRPDSVTLASIDATTGRTVLFSLPRNLEDVPLAPGSPAAGALPNGWSCGDACLLNAVYTWGAGHASLFPGARDPGAEAMKEAVAGVTGLPVNYYVLIDLQGFRQLIDAMGGITLSVSRPVPIGGGTSRVKGYIQPGTQHLDGYHALWFARSRHGASDYARMQRQRCVMNAMLHQLDPARVLANFEDIAAASSHVVSTDLPAGELGRFVGLAAGARSQPLTSVQFVPPLIDPAHPDMAAVRAKVTQTLQAASGLASPPAPSATKPAGSVDPGVARHLRPGVDPLRAGVGVRAGVVGSGVVGSGSSGPGSSVPGSSVRVVGSRGSRVRGRRVRGRRVRVVGSGVVGGIRRRGGPGDVRRRVCLSRLARAQPPSARRRRPDRPGHLDRRRRLDADTARREACGEDHGEAKWSLERESPSS